MNKNLFSLLLGLTLLAMNCISCSHNRAISADAGLSDESTTEVSASESTDTAGEVSDLSQEVEAKAEDLVGSSEDKAPLEATASLDSPVNEDPTQLSGDQVQVAQASSTETSTETVVQPEDSSVKPATMSDSTTSSFGALPTFNTGSNEEPKKPVVKKPAKKKQTLPAPHVEKAVPEKKVEEPVASNVEDPFVDELNAPIPEQEKPKLASAEIGSFIERHAFLVTLCGVAFIFGIFIVMRRKKDHEDHNLSV